MKIFGRIYKITNLKNNKVYIGQTINSIKKRFRGHIRESQKNNSNMYIARAIKKYGKENFIIEEVAIAYSREELNALEAFYIKEYKSNTKLGYNICEITNNQVCKSKKTIEKFRINMNKPERKKISSELGKARRGIKLTNTSKYLGVKKQNNWIARLSINSKDVYIGSYATEIEAAQARDIAELNYFGDKAILNFPELKEKYLSKEIKPQNIDRIKKSDSKVIGVYFSNNKKIWIFKLKDYKTRQFKNQIDAENYAKKITSVSKEEKEKIELRKKDGNLPGVHYSNTLDKWIAKTVKNKARSFNTREEAENQIMIWKNQPTNESVSINN